MNENSILSYVKTVSCGQYTDLPHIFVATAVKTNFESAELDAEKESLYKIVDLELTSEEKQIQDLVFDN